MSFKGKKNVYLCENCGRGVITQDMDEGVTPFMTACDFCNGTATSLCYNIPQEWLAKHKPAIIWRKPTAAEMSKLSFSALEHVRKGGLLSYQNEQEKTEGPKT